MPRRARLILPNVPLHLIQRGNNRAVCFYAEDDYCVYLDGLARAARDTGCAVHAYCLMTNHVHLVVSPASAAGAGALMKQLGQRYVQYINRSYRRSGTLWEGRFRSCLLHAEDYLLACQRYVELNPVRAGLVEHPASYRWSSYRANTQGETLPGLTPHPLYLALGVAPEARQAAYRELFRTALEPGLVDDCAARRTATTRSATRAFTPRRRRPWGGAHSAAWPGGRYGGRRRRAGCCFKRPSRRPHPAVFPAARCLEGASRCAFQPCLFQDQAPTRLSGQASAAVCFMCAGECMPALQRLAAVFGVA